MTDVKSATSDKRFSTVQAALTNCYIRILYFNILHYEHIWAFRSAFEVLQREKRVVKTVK